MAREIQMVLIACFIVMIGSFGSIPAGATANSDCDSIPDIQLFSNSGTQTASFFDGVVPPSPQAQALARYAEFPVGLFTGLPSVSIPLYEIELGGYMLPISIDYHYS